MCGHGSHIKESGSLQPSPVRSGVSRGVPASLMPRLLGGLFQSVIGAHKQAQAEPLVLSLCSTGPDPRLWWC